MSGPTERPSHTRSGRAERPHRSFSPPRTGGTGALDQADFARLLGFRDGLRRFLRWSEDQAKAVGLTPSQHQLLLAIQGHSATTQPSVGDVADHLLLRHHSVVELIDRAEAAGLVRRILDAGDHRVVRLALTPKGRTKLSKLSATHLEELSRLAGELPALRG